MRIFYTCSLLFTLSGSFAQSKALIEGIVSSSDGILLVGANVFIEESKEFTHTQNDGSFVLYSKLKGSEYTLIISILGYKKFRKKIELTSSKQVSLGIIVLEQDRQELDEVVLAYKTKTQKKREEPIVVSVVDIGKVSERSSTLVQLINQSSGIKIRQSSGVGSGVSVNINGLQGKAIRFFKDGIPMDYLGRAFRLSLVPSDFLSSVEVYKGVMPVSLGADALGGGINLITKQRDYNYLNTSYQMGSFNTHQGTINGKHNFNDNLYLGFSSYFTHSDNDYKVEADYVNPDTANTEKRTVRRFHDAISSYFINPVIGIRNVGWADKLELGWNHFNLKSDFQHNLRMSRPYGEVNWGEKSNIYTIDYLKKQGNFQVKYFVSIANRKEFFADISDYRYYWGRKREEKQDMLSGETRGYKILQNLTYISRVSRLNFKYAFARNHNLIFNYVYLHEDRVGSDPNAPKVGAQKIDLLTVKSIYKKHILGLGLSSMFGEFKNIFTIKHYSYESQGVSLKWSWSPLQSDKIPYPHSSSSSWGIGNSIKYIPIQHNEDIFIRFSYEFATRLPDGIELFGDAMNILSNVMLKPETSHNANLGFHANINSQKTWFSDINVFYRKQKNLIILIPQFEISRYENWKSAKSFGIEVGVKGNILKSLSLNFNGALQDLRRLPKESRLPNIPFLFGNTSFNYAFKNVFKQQDRMGVYINYSFTYRYYLEEIPKALEGKDFFSKPKINNKELIIPSQNTLDMGISYSKGSPFSINLEVRNILNAKLYDKFRVQKPGLAMYFKLVYSFNQKSKSFL